MRTHDFQNPNQQSQKQKQKSISTSSFYRQPPPKPTYKNYPQLSHTIESQQRETSQSIDKLNLILENKTEYFSKRIQESYEQNKVQLGEVVVSEKGLIDSAKNMQRNDKTREWSTQMQKTIQSIILTHRQSDAKLIGKLVNQYKSIQFKCQQIDTKRREQKKQREKQWEQVIDNIGQTIIQAETVIEGERQQMQIMMSKIQKDILDMEENSATIFQEERMRRKQEHEYLTKLIEKIMDKLIC